jgi:phospholipase C
MNSRKMGFALCLASLFFFAQLPDALAGGLTDIKTVFIIMMENHNWSEILDSTNCPYIKNTLVPRASFCTQYYNPPALHPSLPNYLWLESGTNFGILSDGSPANFPPITTTNHLVTLLHNAGISWKAYEQGIPGNTCPTTDISATKYVARHDPFVFFTDVTGNFSYCTNHIRPYTELAADLQKNNVARYNFITPNLTNDMHDLGAGYTSRRVEGDYWLSLQVPQILNSHAYSNNGALFIIWDEGTSDTSDGPIGCMVLSPVAKGHAYSNTVHYTHSSTLRTMQDIFGVQPYLRDAANATALNDLFIELTFTQARFLNGQFAFTIGGTIPGRTNVIEASQDLVNWGPIATNVSASTSLTFVDRRPVNAGQQFYRVLLRP